MTEVYTTGTWRPKPGHEDLFVAAWTEFARWASEHEGSGMLRLTRDLADPGRYVSFGPWVTIEHVRAWKGSDQFRERIGRVREHVDEFTPDELETLARVEEGVIA